MMNDLGLLNYQVIHYSMDEIFVQQVPGRAVLALLGWQVVAAAF